MSYHLKFDTDKTYLSITGKTFHIKEMLKSLNAVWNSEKSCWLLPVHIDSSNLRSNLQEKAYAAEINAKLKEKAERAAARAYAASQEGKEEAKAQEKFTILWALEQKNKNGSYQWICCENCKIIDWYKQHTTCDSCAEYGNSFRISGRLYTGD